MKNASLALRKPRAERTAMIRQRVGSHYSEMGAAREVPVNLVALFDQIIAPSLIANNPRVMLSTFDRQLKPIVEAEQRWVNARVEKQRLNVALRRTVTDALYFVGICKVALATPGDAARYSWRLNAGEPFAMTVSLDDFLYDVHARDFDEVGWIGHRLRVPLEVARDFKGYTKARKDLQAQRDPQFNAEGDERASLISRGTYSEGDEYEDMTTLWEIYLPRHRVVVTLAADDAGGIQVDRDPIGETGWVGPEQGPIHVLGYGTVPDNAMPVSPLAAVLDMHLAANNCWRKLIRQAHDLKQLTTYQAGSAEDSERIRLASDGDMVPLVNPDGVKKLVVNGPDQTLYALAQAIQQLYDFLAGNLALQGGLAPQSKTAHQDELLNENASRVTTDRQNKTLEFVSEVIRAEMWYFHHHPSLDMGSHVEVPGLKGVAVPTPAPAANRQGVRFEDMDIRVDPYSLTHKTPQQRAQDMNGVVTQIILPMLQLLVQDGVAFDANAYLKKLGQYLDQPDLADILTIVQPPEGPPPGGGSAGPSPGSTTRNYVRESRSSQTPRGQATDSIQKLMNSGSASPNQNGQMRAGV